MPGIPLQLQVFSALLGNEESVHSINLPNLFSSGGCKNIWIDKYGRATKIDGYTKQNSSAYTMHTGGAASMVRGLFPYRNTSSGTISRQLLVVFDDNTGSHYDVVVSSDDGVTFTFLSDFGAGMNGTIPIFAQFGQITYLVNGKVSPKQWDGTTFSTAGKTQSPVPTATDSGSTGQLFGHYNYKLVSINSDSSRAYASLLSNTLPIAGRQVSLTWSADPDGTKKGYELYRTTGSGQIMYLVTFINGVGSTSYTDNISDYTILQNSTLPVYGDPPPTTYYAIPHKQRMWWLRTDANPTRGYYSDPGLADSVYQVANFLDFSDTDTVGDTITGGIGNFEGLLLVSTERAIWRVSGTGQVINNVPDWQKTRSNAQTGSVSMRSAVRVPAGAKYSDELANVVSTNQVMAAYFTPVGDIRLFDGDNDRIISLPVKTTLSTFNYQYRAKIFAVTDEVRAEITWVFPAGISSEPSLAVTWNYRWGTWSTRNWVFGHAIECDTSTVASEILAGEPQTTTGGFVYKAWNGNSFAGANINAQWMSKTIYGVNQRFGDGVQTYGQQLISHQKRWRWMDLLLATMQNAPLTVEWLKGNTSDTAASVGNTTVSSAGQTLITSQGSTILTSQGSSIVVATASSIVRTILHGSNGRYMHDTGLRLRISDNATNGAWSIEGLNLAFQVIPGLQRRMELGD